MRLKLAIFGAIVAAVGYGLNYVDVITSALVPWIVILAGLVIFVAGLLLSKKD